MVLILVSRIDDDYDRNFHSLGKPVEPDLSVIVFGLGRLDIDRKRI